MYTQASFQPPLSHCLGWILLFQGQPAPGPPKAPGQTLWITRSNHQRPDTVRSVGRIFLRISRKILMNSMGVWEADVSNAVVKNFGVSMHLGGPNSCWILVISYETSHFEIHCCLTPNKCKRIIKELNLSVGVTAPPGKLNSKKVTTWLWKLIYCV